MKSQASRTSAQLWFRRSMALTVVVGAVLVLLVAVRPGYAAFWVFSTLAFVLAGFLWGMGEPPETGRRRRALPQPLPRSTGLTWARSYRISLVR